MVRAVRVSGPAKYRREQARDSARRQVKYKYVAAASPRLIAPTCGRTGVTGLLF